MSLAIGLRQRGSGGCAEEILADSLARSSHRHHSQSFFGILPSRGGGSKLLRGIQNRALNPRRTLSADPSKSSTDDESLSAQKSSLRLNGRRVFLRAGLSLAPGCQEKQNKIELPPTESCFACSFTQEPGCSRYLDWGVAALDAAGAKYWTIVARYLIFYQEKQSVSTGSQDESFASSSHI